MSELCEWLRGNSSGVYRKCAIAADLIEEQAQELEAKDARIAGLIKALENVVLEYCDIDGAEDEVSNEQSAPINAGLKALNYDS